MQIHIRNNDTKNEMHKVSVAEPVPVGIYKDSQDLEPLLRRKRCSIMKKNLLFMKRMTGNGPDTQFGTYLLVKLKPKKAEFEIEKEKPTSKLPNYLIKTASIDRN
jgi:hypothetical protein